MIEVKQTGEGDPLQFAVAVREGGSETHHRVTMSQGTYEGLTDRVVSPVRCVQAAFEYLLKREPKESILRSFDITVISRYFPGFKGEFRKYIEG